MGPGSLRKEGRGRGEADGRRGVRASHLGARALPGSCLPRKPELCPRSLPTAGPTPDFWSRSPALHPSVTAYFLPLPNKALVFPVVIYGCGSWTIKKAEHRRIGAFELLCWRRLLRVPWTARRSNQSILKEISPEYSLEGLMLKLKLQYFSHLMQRTNSLENTLILGKTEGSRRRG